MFTGRNSAINSKKQNKKNNYFSEVSCKLCLLSKWASLLIGNTMLDTHTRMHTHYIKQIWCLELDD